MKLSEYYDKWITTYKKNNVRSVTYQKYLMTGKSLKEIEPDCDISKIDRGIYQKIVNKYAEAHEHLTVMDFHRQIRASVLDAADEGIIERDFTRRVQIGGKPKTRKLKKFLEEDEAKIFIADLNINTKELNWDHFLLLLINTGLRYAEALALTPSDFDFISRTIDVNKSYDYKSKTKTNRFQPTKNVSSNRIISLDLKTAWILRPLIEKLNPTEPIFPYWYGGGHVIIYNSTINDIIARHCNNVGINKITVHGLRHTHASLLIAKKVSIQAVAKRLGHANTITTQSTYIHPLKAAMKEADEKIESILVNM
ncbi:tyrosine-type recombinase/integrase [Clostridium felsineum]|uniref:Tyrosine recombinase XerC n=1 Tax=Clostridium felsineum TaxID=36839 RepID=A0A1S8MDR3_9CLOT|nr:site-specific integrase [Clostridium felsineum]URZ06463.1 Tyrosine recombinase XerC [Clostridium felsineum]URZ11498.1 Tyrosine recombinase XerC [Clostridium felsineum]